MFSVTIKGIPADSTVTTSATLLTLKNYAGGDGKETELWSDTTTIQELLDSVQPLTSATIDGYSYQLGTQLGTYGTPAAPMDSTEMFTDDFSDVTVTPTLTIKFGPTGVPVFLENQAEVLQELYTKNINVALKYVTDPSGADFNTNVQAFIKALSEWGTVTDTLSPLGDGNPVLSGKVTFTVDEDIEG